MFLFLFRDLGRRGKYGSVLCGGDSGVGRGGGVFDLPLDFLWQIVNIECYRPVRGDVGDGLIIAVLLLHAVPDGEAIPQKAVPQTVFFLRFQGGVVFLIPLQFLRGQIASLLDKLANMCGHFLKGDMAHHPFRPGR